MQIVQAQPQGQAQQAQSGAGQTMQVMQQIITNTGEIQQIPVSLPCPALPCPALGSVRRCARQCDQERLEVSVHTYTRTHTDTHTQTLRHTYTHRHTQTHRHTLSLSLSLSLFVVNLDHNWLHCILPAFL